MIAYPAFVAAVAELDVEELAERSIVRPEVIQQIAAGGWAAPAHLRPLLAAALGVDPAELFRAVSLPSGTDLEAALAAAPSRFVTDPATLRQIDRPRPAA